MLQWSSRGNIPHRSNWRWHPAPVWWGGLAVLISLLETNSIKLTSPLQQSADFVSGLRAFGLVSS